MKPGKRIATWHNDGTPNGRFEWEPGKGPRWASKGIVAGVLAAVLLVALIHIPANLMGIPDMVGLPLWFLISFLVGIPAGYVAMKVGRAVDR